MPYLTGNTIPGSFRCKVVRIPDDLAFLDALNGQLYELTLPENWETDGTITAQQMADAFSDIYEEYTTEVCMEIPIGSLMQFGGATAPSKWLLCDGASLSRAAYPELFAIIGVIYGAVDSTHFSLPDMRGRSPMQPGSGVVTALGQQAGADAVSLSLGNLPSHDHDFADAGHIHTITDPGHIHTITDPGHIHVIEKSNGVAGGTVSRPGANFTGQTAPNTQTLSATTGISVNSHATGLSVDSHASGLTFHAQGSNAPHANLHPVLGVNSIIYAGR